MTIEYKGQGAIKLPVEKSPKIVITTNYTIKGEGGSFDARKHELELSSYFNSNYSPLDEFKHMLFDDWDEKEWSRFDNFMIQCIQYYMQFGLQKQQHKNLEMRKLINDISTEFFDWCEDGNLVLNKRWTNTELFTKFTDENLDFKKMSHRALKKWVRSYCDYKGYIYQDGTFNNQRYFYITQQQDNSYIEQLQREDEEKEFPFK